MTTALATAGAPLGRAKAAVILLHGRGASAQGMLDFAAALDRPDIAWLAPQAPGAVWYPLSFLAPLSQNEPALSQALATVGDVVTRAAAHGIAPERLVLLGFSQGGCLALEYAARNAQRFGGVVGLSAGLIGPPGTPRIYAGTLAATPVFVGCSDVDAHIPLERVKETAAVMRRLGGEVTERIYPGMGHTINADEMKQVRLIIDGVAQAKVSADS
jgi:phospholipase/carboxylesterase